MSLAASTRIRFAAPLAVACTTSLAGAADLQLIFSEIPSSPTSHVPGALDAAGLPVQTLWISMTSPALSVHIQGDEWVVRGATTQASTNDAILVKGSGTTGTMFLQDGQPVANTEEPGELWDFFDATPVAFNAAGQIAYSARARGGVTSNDEKLFTFINGTHTLIAHQGSPLFGLQSLSASIACNSPTMGNSAAGVHMLNNGVVAWGNTPITGCSSFLYPALFHNDTAVFQNGVEPIISNPPVGDESLDGFTFDAAAFSPDGQNILVPVSTNNPNAAADYVLLLDNNVIMREGSPIPNSGGVILNTVSKTWFGPNGQWYARGTDPSGGDWAVRGGVLLAKTGQPITPGATENWGDVISTFVGNSHGDYIVVGNTTNANANLNTVIVRNGAEVLVREGDPVDVNDNGLFDDDTFVNAFHGNGVFLTDANILYFTGSLRNGAGTNIGDAFIRADVTPASDCPADTNNDGNVNVTDLLAVIGAWGPCATCPAIPCDADVAPPTGDCQINVTDLLAVIGAWGPCP